MKSAVGSRYKLNRTRAELLAAVDAGAREFAVGLRKGEFFCGSCHQPMTEMESLQAGLCIWCRTKDVE